MTIQTGPPKSKLPIFALLLSVLAVVPVAPLVGMMLGVMSRRGSRLAGMAIILGLVFTLAQVFAGYRAYQYDQNVNGAPGTALSAGYGGDYDGFSAVFITDGAAGQGDVQSFLAELEERYGVFHADRLVESSDSGRIAHRYELVFDRATLKADAAICVDPRFGANWFASGMQYLKIYDPGRGDLVFPSTTTTQVAAEPTSH